MPRAYILEHTPGALNTSSSFANSIMIKNIQARPRAPSRVNLGFVSTTILLLAATPVANTITAVAPGQSGVSSTTTTTAGSSPTTSTSPVVLITPGTECTDAEALFNCLTTSWQQCASGQWSIAQEGAEGDGLVCAPPGLSYDMDIVYANGTGAAGAETSGAAGGADPTGTGAGGDGSVVGAQGTAAAATTTTTATTPGGSGGGTEGQSSGVSALRVGGRISTVISWSWCWYWLGTLLFASIIV